MTALSERIVGLYERHARDWAARRSRLAIEKTWLDRLCGLLPTGGAVLDLGCGSGEPIGRRLLEQGYRVTGIDAAPSMIALCRERLSAGDWRVADMRELELGTAYDGLIAWDSFFHLDHDDQRRMFPVFRRHAAGGAALLFTSGPWHGEAVGSYQGEPLYHASLAESEYRTLLAANGFEVVAYVAEDPDCGGRTVWLARRRGQPAAGQ
jgi:SAM-dependent methyltransferase